MEQITKQIDVDFYEKKTLVVYAKQGDASTRFFSIRCFNQGTLIKFDSTKYKAYVRMRKPDNTGVFNPATITSTGTITVELTEQMLAAKGMGYMDVLVTEGTVEIDNLKMINPSKVLSSMVFNVNVIPKSIQDTDIKSSNEFNILIELEDYAQRAHDRILELEKIINVQEITVPKFLDGNSWRKVATSDGEIYECRIKVQGLSQSDSYDISYSHANNESGDNENICQKFYDEEIVSIETLDNALLITATNKCDAEFYILLYGKVDADCKDYRFDDIETEIKNLSDSTYKRISSLEKMMQVVEVTIPSTLESDNWTQDGDTYICRIPMEGLSKDIKYEAMYSHADPEFDDNETICQKFFNEDIISITTKDNEVVITAKDESYVEFYILLYGKVDESEKIKSLETRINGVDDNLKNLANAFSSQIPQLTENINKVGSYATQVDAKVTECFQSVSNGKKLVASAITDKGIPTEATAAFSVIAENVGKIQTGGGGGFVSTTFLQTPGMTFNIEEI